jgi:hypothetical protein
MAPPVAIRRCCRQRLQQKVEALLFAGLFYKKNHPDYAKLRSAYDALMPAFYTGCKQKEQLKKSIMRSIGYCLSGRARPER